MKIAYKYQWQVLKKKEKLHDVTGQNIYRATEKVNSKLENIRSAIQIVYKKFLQINKIINMEIIT